MPEDWKSEFLGLTGAAGEIVPALLAASAAQLRACALAKGVQEDATAAQIFLNQNVNGRPGLLPSQVRAVHGVSIPSGDIDTTRVAAGKGAQAYRLLGVGTPDVNELRKCVEAASAQTITDVVTLLGLGGGTTRQQLINYFTTGAV